MEDFDFDSIQAKAFEGMLGLEDWVYDINDNSLRLKIRVVNKSENAIPFYQKDGDSGFDIPAYIPKDIIIKPLKRAIIPTGLYYQIPTGFEMQIRSRSGLAANKGIMVLNSPGTIDCGFRGEIKIILFNTSDEDFLIKSGDRIAQGVITSVQNKMSNIFIETDKLDDSDRGEGGFGHTGV